ncbi:MAG: plastocyanin/azurin family copper-binding protein [Actinomycetota bacterium]
MRKQLVVLFMPFLLIACGGDGEPSSNGEATGSVEVKISAFRYMPDPVEIGVGDTVTWLNDDNIDHTVTSGTQREQGVPGVEEGSDAKPDGIFDGALAEKGETFSFKFDEAGTYPYYCAIHAGMTGTVEVSA